MKFVADINIPQLLIRKLRILNHRVLDIKRINLEINDLEIIKIARDESRVILTRDKDYIALAQFPKYQVPIIAIRLINQTDAQYITNKTLDFLRNNKESIILNSLTIIREDAATSYQYPL
ncbi:DUF5615 family PIN-like protein [Candidatus Daviesbacteria bacterium]|nr:DUF5615 family PIN-like protein [Candidatus Daviesbacteria bacterium]